MVSKVRSQRIADRIREDLSEILLQQVSDPRLVGISITDVEVDRELAYAEVFVSAQETGSICGKRLLMFKEHPLLGVGTGGWKHASEELARSKRIPDSLTRYGTPHNVFFEALSSRGMIGLLALLALICYPLFLAVAARKETGTKHCAMLLLCASMAFILSGMTDTLVIIRGVFSSYLVLTGIGLAMLFRSPVRT